MAEWRIAVQAPGARFQVSLPASSSIDHLQDVIEEKGGVPKRLQKLSCGFPPKEIASNPQQTIEASGIANGDMIRVTALSEPAVAVTSTTEGQGVEQNAAHSSSRKIVRKVIPADNSCLFNSVAYCMEGRRMDMSTGLRELIAAVVLSDPVQFDESVLSKAGDEYAKWILDKDSWGGAIECRILADHYKTEIVAIDCQSLRAYRFGEDMAFKERIMLMYDGIHYDVMAEANADEGQEELYTTIFPAEDEEALELAKRVVGEAKAKGQFTDVANFAIRCLVCGEGLKGAKEAQEHASSTGHTNFAENK
mmetsp:Transcript_39953/g.81815  ORF Transcript_39953/g.81815 Transcript_39953/m.81815 type:complete len:307 (+) Transcript_39953:146-1066(+)